MCGAGGVDCSFYSSYRFFDGWHCTEADLLELETGVATLGGFGDVGRARSGLGGAEVDNTGGSEPQNREKILHCLLADELDQGYRIVNVHVLSIERAIICAWSAAKITPLAESFPRLLVWLLLS